jgi:methionyl aminopeptidase
MAIKIKSKEQIELMREGGRITAGALKAVLAAVRVGVTTEKLDKVAEDFIFEAGGEPAFKRVPNYDFSTCLNLNEGVVHGLPSQRKLKEGDILTVDLGTFYKGLNTDVAWTVYVGQRNKAAGGVVHFLATGEKALSKALGQARAGNKVGDISQAMESVLREGGYSPVDILVGHGIGAELHEDPQIPCLVIHSEGPELKVGVTIAVEVIYTAGDSALEVLSDNWTFVTADRSLAGLFEHTIGITRGDPIVLTSFE